MDINKLICDQLRSLAAKVERGELECTKGEAMRALSLFAHEPLSKEEACHELNISRATFDRYVKAGKLPAGQHRLGFKELMWYKDELYSYLDEFE